MNQLKNQNRRSESKTRINADATVERIGKNPYYLGHREASRRYNWAQEGINPWAWPWWPNGGTVMTERELIAILSEAASTRNNPHRRSCLLNRLANNRTLKEENVIESNWIKNCPRHTLCSICLEYKRQYRALVATVLVIGIIVILGLALWSVFWPLNKNMLDALIQHQVYSYRASTAVVNELNGLFTKAMNQTAQSCAKLLDEFNRCWTWCTVGRYTTDTLKEIKSTFDEGFILPPLRLLCLKLSRYQLLHLRPMKLLIFLNFTVKKLNSMAGKVLAGIKKKPVMGGMLFDDVWKNLAESTRNKALVRGASRHRARATRRRRLLQNFAEAHKMQDGSFKYVGGIVEEVRKNGIEGECEDDPQPCITGSLWKHI